MTFVPMTYLKGVWSRIALRRADILGREQGQAIVRVAITTTVLGYLVVHRSPLSFDQGAPDWLVFLIAFLLFSGGIAATALRSQQSHVYRRVAANVADVIAVTYIMTNTGEAGAALFLLYLWVTLGNGFRFGLVAMSISAVLSVVGFAIVVLNVELWREHAMLSAGVMVALLVLPACVAQPIRQLHRACKCAEEASAAKSKFLARMGHELRTPLHGVLDTTDLLRNNHRFTAADRELLSVIQESVNVSLRQIDSVLDFARIEAGKLVLEQTEFHPKGTA